MAASFATRAMDFAAGQVWGKTINNGMSSLFPSKDDTFMGMVIYAIVLSVMVILIKEVIEWIVEFIFPEQRSKQTHGK